jgi:hypothetical protein
MPLTKQYQRAVLAVFGLPLLAPFAHGAVLDYDLFKTIAYSQTSNAQPTTPTVFFGSVAVDSDNTTDFTAGNVTSTSALSPMVLMVADMAGNFQSPGLGSQAELNADFPNGTTYTYNISGGTLGSQSATLSTPASDEYASTIPFFTNSGFTSLQGVNATNPITLTWNPYATPAGINTPLIFLAISRASDGALVTGTSGNNSLASFTVPANVLQPGTQYDVDLVFSARNATANAGFGGAASFYSYDLRTDLDFTTAAATPEPSSLSIAALGILGFAGLLTWKRKRFV